MPDKSAFVQLGIFLVVFSGLYFLVFKPLTRIILLRRRRTTGVLEEAKALEERIRELSSQYNANVSSARVEGSKLSEASLNEGAKEASAIKEAARKDASVIAKEAAAQIERSKNAALKEIRTKLPDIVDQIMKKVT